VPNGKKEEETEKKKKEEKKKEIDESDVTRLLMEA
jgi:hypothetical protein